MLRDAVFIMQISVLFGSECDRAYFPLHEMGNFTDSEGYSERFADFTLETIVIKTHYH